MKVNIPPPQLPQVVPAVPQTPQVPQIPQISQIAAHEDTKYSKSYRPVTIDMLQSNNQFNIQTFFDLQYSEGSPIYRYVDDMNVDWD